MWSSVRARITYQCISPPPSALFLVPDTSLLWDPMLLCLCLIFSLHDRHSDVCREAERGSLVNIWKEVWKIGYKLSMSVIGFFIKRLILTWKYNRASNSSNQECSSRSWPMERHPTDRERLSGVVELICVRT